jgi:hypothetical protein
MKEGAASPRKKKGGEVAPVEHGEGQPVYKKWWFWTAIGGGVAAIAIIGIAAGVASSNHPSLPSGVTTIMFKL